MSPYQITMNQGAWLILTLSAMSLVTSSASAQAVPGVQPKKWPANPEKHQIIVNREVDNDREASMIAAAEDAVPSKESLLKALEAPDRDDPLGLLGPKPEKLPEGDKVWWYQEKLGIRIPAAITGEAIEYYMGLVEQYGKQSVTREIEPSSRLEYLATVAFHPEFKIDDKSFEAVQVVNLKLIFDQSFAATAGDAMHFEKTRIVVLDDNAKVLYISGDGATAVPILSR